MSDRCDTLVLHNLFLLLQQMNNALSHLQYSIIYNKNWLIINVNTYFFDWIWTTNVIEMFYFLHNKKKKKKKNELIAFASICLKSMHKGIVEVIKLSYKCL
jgi:hypothetical protein